LTGDVFAGRGRSVLAVGIVARMGSA